MPRLRLVSQPRDWLLLLIAYRRRSEGLDPIRVQKGMFLLAQEGGLPASETYSFRPYNYGPMSDALYVDLADLVREGLCEPRPVPGYSWCRYVPAPRAEARVRALARSARRRAPETFERLLAIESLLARCTFSELLDEVYTSYPEHAARSVFRRP